VRPLAFALALAICLGATWAGSQCAGPQRRLSGPAVHLDPRYRRLAALGFKEVQADLLWAQAGVAFGEGVRARHVDTAQLAELINEAVDLDPYYYDAYWYGASLLPAPEANALLKKGCERFPRDWKLPEMIGFNYQLYLHDYESAGRYYELAAQLPGHPPYVPSMAGRLYSEADDIESAIRVLENFHRTCERKDLKEDFGRRIQQLWNIKVLSDACAEYRRWSHHAPGRLDDLVQAGIIAELPPDPFGGRYYLTAKGRVACDADRNCLRG
jgi:tetratricopeptide (TPR) repeat protein